MSLKKLATWLLVIGLIALIVGAVIGALTLNVVALKEKIAEKKAGWDGCEKDDVECWKDLKDGCDDECWAKKKAAWNKGDYDGGCLGKRKMAWFLGWD